MHSMHLKVHSGEAFLTLTRSIWMPHLICFFCLLTCIQIMRCVTYCITHIFAGFHGWNILTRNVEQCYFFTMHTIIEVWNTTLKYLSILHFSHDLFSLYWARFCLLFAEICLHVTSSYLLWQYQYLTPCPNDNSSHLLHDDVHRLNLPV